MHLPSDAVVASAMLDLNGQVATLVKATELGVWWIFPLLESACKSYEIWCR